MELIKEFSVQEKNEIYDDVNLSRHIFEDFRSLIAPLKEYETAKERLETVREQKAESQAVISGAWITPFAAAFVTTLALAIPFLVVFFIVTHLVDMPNGKSLFYAYDNWCVTTTLFDWYKVILEPLSTSVWGSALAFLLGLLGYVVFPCATILFPCLFVVFVITTIISVVSAKRAIPQHNAVIQATEDSIAILEDELTEPIKNVPEAYRFSAALEHFYWSYANGKARTIREAMRLYDEAVKEQRKEERHRESMDMHGKILEAQLESNRATKDLEKELRKIRWKL